jgi:hypothetical protein
VQAAFDITTGRRSQISLDLFLCRNREAPMVHSLLGHFYYSPKSIPAEIKLTVEDA